VVPIKPIYVYTELAHLPDIQLVKIVYKCVYDGGEIVLNPEEHDQYQWIAYDDIGKFKCIAFLENLLRNYNF